MYFCSHACRSSAICWHLQPYNLPSDKPSDATPASTLPTMSWGQEHLKGLSIIRVNLVVSQQTSALCILHWGFYNTFLLCNSHIYILFILQFMTWSLLFYFQSKDTQNKVMWFLCRYMNLCVCDGGCLRCKGHRRKFCLEYQLVQIGIISFTRVNMLTVMRGANKALIDLTEVEVELDQHESHLWRLDRLISLWSLCAVILPHYTSYVHAHIVIIWLWGNPPPPLFFSFRRETRTTNPS